MFSRCDFFKFQAKYYDSFSTDAELFAIFVSIFMIFQFIFTCSPAQFCRVVCSHLLLPITCSRAKKEAQDLLQPCAYLNLFIFAFIFHFDIHDLVPRDPAHLGYSFFRFLVFVFFFFP